MCEIQFKYYPTNKQIPDFLNEIIKVFESVKTSICSPQKNLNSNEVLEKVSKGLKALGFNVEISKKNKITFPVLFGKNGKIEKKFYVDGYNEEKKIVIEVEAGRAWENNQFLKDLFEACLISDVDYLVIAVRNIYKKKDFNEIIKYFDSLYASDRLTLPLKGILIIGY